VIKHLQHLACPACRRPMKIVDWRPGTVALWQCDECASKHLLGRRLLEGSYDGRLLLAPAFANPKEPEHP
jgi:hypothetical protein